MATETVSAELLNYLDDNACMYHRDNPGQCDKGNSEAYYRVSGDLWCQAGLDEFGREFNLREELGIVRLAGPASAGSDEIYGVSGAAAQWIRDNVGLN